MRTRCLLLLPLMLILAAGCNAANKTASSDAGASVIFMHHDGMSSASWAAVRALHVGPDNDLNWDTLPAIAVYRGHMADRLHATSNGGATTHATGVRVETSGFGRYSSGKDAKRLVDESGKPLSVALQALDAGMSVGLVQTGIGPEPGTACFVTDAASRGDFEDITAQLVESGAQVIFCGGEKYFLPEGVEGWHGKGVRKDGRNLLEEAQEAGYALAHNRKDIMTIAANHQKVLGVFAHDATFNAHTDEDLAKKGLPYFEPEAPTVAEMTEAALKVLENNGKRFLLVVEEEGTDNFGNKNNAAGVLEAGWRADRSYGVAQDYLKRHPRTLLLTCADSDGGGMRLLGVRSEGGRPIPPVAPATSNNGAPVDGVAGPGTPLFLARPDKAGRRLPFMIVWPTYSDVAGGILVRAQGFNSERVRGSMDNTEVAELMRDTLFGK